MFYKKNYAFKNNYCFSIAANFVIIPKFVVRKTVKHLLGKSLGLTIRLLFFHKIVFPESVKTYESLVLNDLLEEMQPTYHLVVYILAPAAFVI